VSGDLSILLHMAGSLPADSSDAALAVRLGREEPGAFEEAISLYRPRVARLARRLLGWPASAADVDDVVQDVFLAILTHARRFRSDSSLSTWITTITLNKCRSHRRAWRSWLRRLRGMRDQAALSEAPADCGVEDIERFAQVRQAVQALRPGDREVIVLHYLEHQDVADVARTLGLSRNAAEVRLHRARARLKVLLKDLVED
jgi:RNA polymerase sigma-70 factor (ECF subfamily)